MKIEKIGYEKLKELVRNYIRLLEKEYDAISEILSFNMGLISAWEEIRMRYIKRLEQIKEMLDRNYDVLKMLERIEADLNCASFSPGSIFGAEVISSAEQRIQEKESFTSLLDSLELIDDDDKELLEDARAQGADIASSIAEASMNTPLSEQVQAAIRRKQLADALRKGEPVIVSPDGQIADTATSDAIAALRKHLADGDVLMVDSDGTIMHSSDLTQVNIGVAVPKGVFGCEDPLPNSIKVPEGKLAGGYGMCRICGTVFNQITNYCPECGTKVVIEKPAVTLDKVQFSALAPKTFIKNDYSIIEIFMYEEAFRDVVQEAIANAEAPVKETKSGILTAEREAKITVTLSSPDIVIEDNTESQTWQGNYLNFSFAVEVPEQYKKRQILFVASVYFNDIIATRLKFVAKCKTLTEQKIEVTREDVLSAFVSYASQDRNRVAMIIQGMKKARPDMDIFFDVDSLRSGDDWEKALWREIDKRDVLFLCWSKYARDSKWVDAEWRYAFKNKGPDSIEPVPIDPPGSCPPPDELSCKHFNDKLLYIINSNFNSISDEVETVSNIENMVTEFEKLF